MAFERALLAWGLTAVLLGLLIGGKPWKFPGGGEPWIRAQLVAGNPWILTPATHHKDYHEIFEAATTRKAAPKSDQLGDVGVLVPGSDLKRGRSVGVER